MAGGHPLATLSAVEEWTRCESSPEGRRGGRHNRGVVADAPSPDLRERRQTCRRDELLTVTVGADRLALDREMQL